MFGERIIVLILQAAQMSVCEELKLVFQVLCQSNNYTSQLNGTSEVGLFGERRATCASVVEGSALPRLGIHRDVLNLQCQRHAHIILGLP